MALIKKISLLCLSILTLNCINNNVYSMNIAAARNPNDLQNYNNGKEFYNLLNRNKFNYNPFNKNFYGFNVNKHNSYDNMLDLYNYKVDSQLKNKRNDSNRFAFLKYNALNNNKFILEFKQNINKIKDTNQKSSFENKVRSILGKFNITDEKISEYKNHDYYRLPNRNNNNTNSNLSNALLNDFLQGKQLSSNLIIDSIITLAKQNDELAEFVLKCIVLDLDVTKKFDLLWTLCKKYEKYFNNSKINKKPNYIVSLIQTISCMVSYDINDVNNKSDDIVAKLLPLMINYYKGFGGYDSLTKNTINKNLVQYISNMNTDNNDELIKSDPSKSFLLFVKDNILSSDSNKYDDDDNEDDYLFSDYLKNNSKNNIEEKDILSGFNSSKVLKLRNIVLVNYDILRLRSNSNRKIDYSIPLFSNKQENNDIVSDNMVLFTDHMKELCQNKDFDDLSYLLKETLEQSNKRILQSKTESLRKLLIDENKIITNVINLAATPDRDRSNEINIHDLQKLFIKNAPNNMKIFDSYSKLDKVSVSYDNLESDLQNLFEKDVEKVAVTLSRMNFWSGENKSHSQLAKRIYNELKTIQNLPDSEEKLITNDIRRKIVKDELIRMFDADNEFSKSIEEFTSYLSTEHSNNIIRKLLQADYNNDDNICDDVYDIVEQIINDCIGKRKLLLQSYIDHCQSEEMVRLFEENSQEAYKSIMRNFSHALNNFIGLEFVKTFRSNDNLNDAFNDVIKFFNALNSNNVQSWFNTEDRLRFIDNFINEFKNRQDFIQFTRKYNVSEGDKEKLFKIIISLKDNSDDNSEPAKIIRSRNNMRMSNAISKNALAIVLDSIYDNDNNGLQIINDNKILISRNDILCSINNGTFSDDTPQGSILKQISKKPIYSALVSLNGKGLDYINDLFNINIDQLRIDIIKDVEQARNDNNSISEQRKAAKNSIHKFVNEYNQRIREFSYAYRNSSIPNLLIDDNEYNITKCAEIFMNFMEAQDRVNVQYILNKMDTLTFVSIFRNIIEEKINDTNENYQISVSEFMKYLMNSTITHEFIKAISDNSNQNISAVKYSMSQALLARVLQSHDDNGNINLLGVVLGTKILKNGHENQNDVIAEINEFKKLTALKEPKTRTIDIEFEDFSNDNNYYMIGVGNNNSNVQQNQINNQNNNIQNPGIINIQNNNNLRRNVNFRRANNNNIQNPRIINNQNNNNNLRRNVNLGGANNNNIQNPIIVNNQNNNNNRANNNNIQNPIIVNNQNNNNNRANNNDIQNPIIVNNQNNNNNLRRNVNLGGANNNNIQNPIIVNNQNNNNNIADNNDDNHSDGSVNTNMHASFGGGDINNINNGNVIDENNNNNNEAGSDVAISSSDHNMIIPGDNN